MKLKTRQTSVLLMAAVLSVIGALLLFVPSIELIHLTYFIGAVAVIGAVYSIVMYFTRDGFKEAENYGFSVGVLLGIVGIAVFVRAENLVEVFPSMLAGYSIFLGVILMQDALDLKRMQSKFFGVMLSISAAVLIFSLVVILFYGDGETIAPILSFVSGLLVLLSEIVVRLYVKGYEKKKGKALMPKEETNEVKEACEPLIDDKTEAPEDGE